MRKIGPMDKRLIALNKSAIKLAKRWARTIEDAEDITQQAMMRMIASPSTPSPVSSRWLYSVVRNSATDFYRRQSRHYRPLEDSMNGVAGYGEHDSIEPCVVQENSDPFVIERIDKELQNLPAIHRRSFLLFASDFSYAEIAAITSAPIGTVRSRLYHARRNLQKSLRACH